VVGVVAKEPPRGCGGHRSKTVERERDEKEVGRMAREGESHCEEEEDNALICYARKKQQQQREEEEATAKQREEIEGTRGGKSFCALKEEIQMQLLVTTAFVCRIRTRLPLTTAFVSSCKTIFKLFCRRIQRQLLVATAFVSSCKII